MLADFITLANASCGMGSVLLCIHYLEAGHYGPYLAWAFALLPLALLFDTLDGAVARWRRKSSPYGADLDSLADIVSFGVAPAVVGFTLGLRGVWDTIILIIFGIFPFLAKASSPSFIVVTTSSSTSSRPLTTPRRRPSSPRGRSS